MRQAAKVGSMDFTVTAFVNEGPGRFFAFAPGDTLVHAGTYTFEAESPEAALNLIWEVGNRMAVDANGTEWPPTVRSLSVGDVLVVGDDVWSVAPVGFDPVPAAAWEVGLLYVEAR